MSQFKCPHGLAACLNSDQCADRTARALSRGNNKDTCPSCNSNDGPLLWVKHKHMVCKTCYEFKPPEAELIAQLKAENAELKKKLGV